MAARLKVNPPQSGLSHIYNVTLHVGGAKTCSNLADDVMLVQFFLRELVPQLGGDRKVQELPIVNGKFDGLTGFWIYHWQNSGEGSTAVDGVISPAKGLTYSNSKAWVISQLNFVYKKHFPQRFDRIPDTPEFTPSLRASLRV
jgi:hypothetical protein